MFAVPGWSITPASLKKQVDQPVSPPSQPQKKTEGAGARKRKRGVGKSAPEQIQDQDISELWKHHIEGKPKSAPTKKVVLQTKPNSTNSTEEKEETNAKPAAIEAPLKAGRSVHKKSKNGGKGVAEDETEDKESSKTKRRKKQREEAAKRQEEGSAAKDDVGTEEIHKVSGNATPIVAPGPAAFKLTPLQAAMRQKLMSARFRHLNQALYTAPSTESMDLFKANPSFFEEYHSGFRQQVSSWPENPVDSFVQELKERGKVRILRQVDKFRASQGQDVKEDKDQGKGAVLPRNKGNGTCVVADLGCGDAVLGKEVARAGAKLKIKVLSYDLYSQNPHVIKADISKLPLGDGDANIAIFCLALMGTNWIDFIEEAWRILHWKGELWIAEIKSRFTRGKQDRVVEHSVGKKRKMQKNPSKADNREEEAELQEQLAVEVDGSEGKSQTDVTAFVEVLRRRGFALENETSIDLSNKMFVRMKFTKSLSPVRGKNQAQATKETTATGEKVAKFLDDRKAEAFDEKSVLKPCLYKLR